MAKKENKGKGDVVQMPKRTKIDEAKFEEVLSRTGNICQAAEAAGYAPDNALRGRACLNKRLKAIVERIVDGKTPGDPEEITADVWRERVANLKNEADMQKLLLEVCGEYLVGRKAVPKGLGEIIKMAGNLKNFQSFAPPPKDNLAGVFIVQAPPASVFDELDDYEIDRHADSQPLAIRPVQGKKGYFTDETGTLLKVRIARPYELEPPKHDGAVETYHA